MELLRLSWCSKKQSGLLMKTFFFILVWHTWKSAKQEKTLMIPTMQTFPLVITFDTSVSFSDVTEGNSDSHVDGWKHQFLLKAKTQHCSRRLQTDSNMHLGQSMMWGRSTGVTDWCKIKMEQNGFEYQTFKKFEKMHFCLNVSAGNFQANLR